MIYIFAFIGLISCLWAIRSIYVREDDGFIKLGKYLFAIIYFSAAVIIVRIDPLITIVMLLLGAAIVSRSNQIYNSQNIANKELFNKHKSTLVDIRMSKRMTASGDFRSNNYALGKDASGLTHIAFNYVNASGERSFRDVDVKKFDGQFIEGYCHLSNAFKTFRLDRVEGDIILRSTGEVINVYRWAMEMETN